MPQFKQLEVTVSGAQVNFDPAQNGAVTVWTQQGVDLANVASVTYSRRPSTSKQTTRKCAFGLTIPYSSMCETTCTATSRGVSLFKLENVVDTRVTAEERGRAYDTLVGLLQDGDVRDAIVNNGSFYS